MPAEGLERYVGRYEFGPQASITVTRDGDHLYAQLTGQGAYQIFPESPNRFFFKIVDARLSFAIGPDGQVSALVLRQNGRNAPAQRVP
jgi:hypothetical protein